MCSLLLYNFICSLCVASRSCTIMLLNAALTVCSMHLLLALSYTDTMNCLPVNHSILKCKLNRRNLIKSVYVTLEILLFGGAQSRSGEVSYGLGGAGRRRRFGGERRNGGGGWGGGQQMVRHAARDVGCHGWGGGLGRGVWSGGR